MKVLKAKIKKVSKYYANGLNIKNKPVWLRIVDFRAEGDKHYKVEAVKSIKSGMPEYFEVWLSKDEISIKQFEDGQITLKFPDYE